MAKRRQSKTGTARSLVTGLARVGDPLVLPDGRVIQPRPSGIDVDKVEPKVKATEYKATKTRNINELGAERGVLNGICCVLMYTILGISSREIAESLKIAEADVKEIRRHPVYGEMFELIKDEFINVNSDLLQARIAAFSNEAVTNMANLAFKGRHEMTQLKATQDILDRGGVGKKDGKGGGIGTDNALRIVVTKGDSTTEVSIGGGEVLP